MCCNVLCCAMMCCVMLCCAMLYAKSLDYGIPPSTSTTTSTILYNSAPLTIVTTISTISTNTTTIIITMHHNLLQYNSTQLMCLILPLSLLTATTSLSIPSLTNILIVCVVHPFCIKNFFYKNMRMKSAQNLRTC